MTGGDHRVLWSVDSFITEFLTPGGKVLDFQRFGLPVNDFRVLVVLTAAAGAIDPAKSESFIRNQVAFYPTNWRVVNQIFELCD
jgi:hypothetical protein